MARKALLIALILSLAAAPALAAEKKAKAQGLESSPSSSAAQAVHQFTGFGQRWTSMSDKEHDSFLLGMLTSFRIYCMEAVESDKTQSMAPQDVNKRFLGCIASNFPYAPVQVKQAMDDLYRDKTNNTIPFDYMYGIALLKVKGEPVEENLAKLRQDSAKLLKGSK